jgi:hypothetical protein
VTGGLGLYFFARAIDLNRQFVEARSDARSAHSEYIASVDPQDVLAMKLIVREKSNLRDFSFGGQLRWGLAFVALWGLNLVDHHFLTPNPQLSLSGQALSFRLQPLEKRSMLLRSAIFPGWGQRYAGHRTRGTIYTLAAQLAIASAFATEDDYVRSSLEYERARAEYLEATTLDQVLAHKREMIDRHEDLRDRYNVRNISLGVLAGIWVMNLIDCYMLDTTGQGTLWSTADEAPPRLGISTRQGSIEVRVSAVRF